MRCPSCGARNVEHAAWCTQCFAALGPRAAAVPTVGTGDRAGPTVGTRDPAVPAVGTRDIRTRDGEVEWRCVGCDGWVALEVVACPTCGSPRTGFGTGSGAGRPDLAVSAAVAASLALPGAGHVLAGSPGTGIARMLLALVWLGGGIATVRGGDGLSGGILLLGAAIVWVSSALDAATAVTGARGQLLEGRRLGALVAAITLGLVLAITSAALRAAA